MKINSAEYVKSFVSIRDFDLPVLPTVSFIGRSNVGKSTLINSLLNRKKLVKTSATPGKTQLLNYFLINNEFYFVDLPGYGFAKTPKEVRKSWQTMISEFLFQCPDLRLITQLVDIRHDPTKDDIAFQEMIKGNPVPKLVIANKADKLKKSQTAKSVKNVQKILKLQKKPLVHSALAKVGREEIWTYVERHLFPVIETEESE